MIELNWNGLKQVLHDKIGLGIKLLFLFLMIYLVNTGTDHRWIKLPFLCVGLFVILFFVKNIRESILWYLFLVFLLIDLFSNYFVRANHHFLLIYITLLVIIFLKNGKWEDFITNIKLLVVIVLLFSTVQKLFSPQFVSGDFYFYMFNTGNFFKPFLYFNQEMSDIVANNKSQIMALGQTDPNLSKTITFQTIAPNLDIISRVFAWGTIAIELAAAICFLIKPKHYVTHLLFIVLILGIFFTRLENGFLTLLSICGVLLAVNIKIRLIYSLLAILFMALIIAQIGFY